VQQLRAPAEGTASRRGRAAAGATAKHPSLARASPPRTPQPIPPSPSPPCAPHQVALLIAGAKERGELENRVTRLLAEAREDRDVIIM
jgi:hypothetical protein